MQKPSIGRIVQYKLSADDAAAINRRRADAAARRRSEAPEPGIARKESGWVEHTGNDAHAGDVVPMVIVRVWQTSVNGQALLDGNDTLWVTSAVPGDGERQYAWPERV